jgi:hypothetical protein
MRTILDITKQTMTSLIWIMTVAKNTPGLTQEVDDEAGSIWTDG